MGNWQNKYRVSLSGFKILIYFKNHLVKIGGQEKGPNGHIKLCQKISNSLHGFLNRLKNWHQNSIFEKSAWSKKEFSDCQSYLRF